MTSLAAAGLVGRDSELSTLDATLARLVAGRGGVVWISGEPGIGKSSLAAALAAGAAGAGCTVLGAAADELTEVFPLRLMADCLAIGLHSTDPAMVEIARLLRGDRAAPPVVDPVTAAAERMLDLIDRLCASSPLVLVAEDLHWADQSSLGLWSRLARAVDQIPLLLVGTSRPVPHRPALVRLSLGVRDLGGVIIDLAPLNETDTIGAARWHLAAQPGPRLTAELARTGGNPLYVRELIEALRRDGSIRMSDGAAELVQEVSTLPESLAASIGRHLTFLSEPTRRAVRLAAVLGADFSAAEWSHVSEQSAVQLAELVEEATAGGVIAAGERGLRFQHDLIRQVLLEETPAPVREEIVRHAARTLAEAGHGVDAVARQLMAASTLEDWAVTWLCGTPESSMHAAPHAFETLLTRAVSTLRANDDPRWEALAVRLAQTQFWLGHDEDAGHTATAVLRHTNDKERLGAMSVQAVRVAGRQNKFDDAMALAEEVLADLALPSRWRARLHAWKALALLCLGRADEAKRLAAEALDQARAGQDQLGIGYAYHVLCLGYPDQRAVLTEAALESLGNDLESADLRVMLLADYLMALLEAGAVDDVEDLVTDAMLTAERFGTARASWIPYWAAGIHRQRGNWDEALRYLGMVEPDGPLGNEARNNAVQILLRRDQRDLAEAHLRGAGPPADADDPQFLEQSAVFAVSLALRAQVDGDLIGALAIGKRALDLADAPNVGPDMVRVALELGDMPTAKVAAAQAINASFPEINGGPLCRALIDDDTHTLLTLADVYRNRGWRPFCAFALEEAAVRLGRDGQVEQARSALTEAVQIYADLGASMDIRRADSRLRTHGIRRGPRSLRRRATHGWEALTPSEIRIARLVANGLSNPDIATKLYVSRATVQTHVSSILAKLGMQSRLELVRQQASLDRLL